MFALAMTATLLQNEVAVEVWGRDAGLRVIRSGSELVEELYAIDDNGKRRLVLVSPTHSLASAGKLAVKPNLLQAGTTGLFLQPPTFAFDGFKRDGNTIVLTSKVNEWQIEKRISVPQSGTEMDVKVRGETAYAYPQVRYLLSSYAFVPDGRRMSSYGKPDSTWAPGFRPRDEQVMGDHFFRSPAVVAQKGTLAATLMPDLDVLSENRPIPTIIDLDCKNGVVDAPLLTYGFCDYKLASHVYFINDASMVKPVPWDLQLGMKVVVDAKAEPFAAYRKAPEALWKRYGSRYFDKILPQAMPFAEYAKVCYPAAFNEKMTGGWFEKKIGDYVCGGVPSGWGLTEGWVSWQGWFNQLRSAWGLRWWGKNLGNTEWVERADKMLNLALAAPMKNGAVPTTFLSRTNGWRGSLILPTNECYYDLTNMAWKGIWMLRWLELPDCPRRDDVRYQVKAMADMMLRYQNPDGSFPTWLDKDMKVVPILDRSAQSALPAWFLAECAKASKAGSFPTDPSRLQKAADFLRSQVVPQQRYYDFETFFSCSPKQCLQMNQKIDDLKMWDQHTMQAPQNTLCMQWTAEALRAIGEVAGNKNPSKESLMALDIMAQYQNVWPISYRKVAYSYGGFGVQNSDGEFNDARQAQFGSTMCDFGVVLGRKDYFERGVAAIRASLTLINHPLHEKLGIYPNPNYPLGLQPENFGHGGSDEQNGRTGFDWGEGSGLASAAEVMEKYGSEYKHAGGWTVRIDGGYPPPPAPAPKPLTNPSFDFTDWRMPGWTFNGDFLHWPARSTRYNFNSMGKPFIGTCEDGKGWFDDKYTGTITSPRFVATKPSMKILVGGGSGAGVYVELLDEEGKRVYIEHGRNTELMDDRTWDLSKHQGKVFQIRIVDQEKGPWGHINVGWIRM